MTTSVRIMAHCNDKTEVVVIMEEGDNLNITRLNDGDMYETYVYGNRSIRIEEVPKNGGLQS